ncbi:MAG: hypothetical protein E6Q89_02525 [Bacteroidia bacterium]|nr:MAG: hypothetical protein E6Q89_02525 [Bacteroidia bacterium]
MREILLKNWTFMRGLRLVAGIALLISAIVSKDTLVGGFSIFFLLQGLFNFNTCGLGGCQTNSCTTNFSDKYAKRAKEIETEH